MSITRFENKAKIANITPGLDDILNAIYPIGVIICGAKPTVGTWEKVEGRFLLGSSGSHKVGSTGGEETHKITVGEMPSHTHGQNPPIIAYGHSSDNSMATFTFYGNDGWKGSDVIGGNPIINTGGGQAHNNMPPYLTVDMYRRIA